MCFGGVELQPGRDSVTGEDEGVEGEVFCVDRGSWGVEQLSGTKTGLRAVPLLHFLSQRYCSQSGRPKHCVSSDPSPGKTTKSLSDRLKERRGYWLTDGANSPMALSAALLHFSLRIAAPVALYTLDARISDSASVALTLRSTILLSSVKWAVNWAALDGAQRMNSPILLIFCFLQWHRDA